MELLEQLKARNIRIFIDAENIKNEQGFPVEFKDRAFLKAVYEDMSPLQVVLKSPQIGLTTLMLVKSFWVAKYLRKDIVYTLPTSADVNDMAGGKINRIIVQN